MTQFTFNQNPSMDLPRPTTPTLQKLQFSSFPFFLKKELTYSFSLFLLFTFILLLNLKAPFFQPLSFLNIGFLSRTLDADKKICAYSYGTWVRDETYANQSYTEDCPFLDPGFQCHRNGRKDSEFRNWRWQPYGCDLPRFNASDLLERSRNKRIVFAGDSIGRNQWESLLCMLAQAVTNHSTIYEDNGKPITKHKGFLSMRFHDYNLTIEYYRIPFLVKIGRPPKDSSKKIRAAIKVDKMHWYSEKLIGADVLVFNAGHWWNKEKTVKMGWYFQEGEFLNITMDETEAFRRSLQTWKSWVVQSLDPMKSYVVFRSISPSHFRNGTWAEGGNCDSFTSPKTKSNLSEILNNQIISNTIDQIKDSYRNVQLLNITHLTGFREDGHPANHREPGTVDTTVQDCSHWCLPGVPDTWNELLYANLLSVQHGTRKTKR